MATELARSQSNRVIPLTLLTLLLSVSCQQGAETTTTQPEPATTGTAETTIPTETTTSTQPTTTTAAAEPTPDCPRHTEADTICLADEYWSAGFVAVTERHESERGEPVLRRVVLTSGTPWVERDPTTQPVVEVLRGAFSLVRFLGGANCTLGDPAGALPTTAWLRMPDGALMSQFGGKSWCSLPEGSGGVDVIGIAVLTPQEGAARIGSEFIDESRYRAIAIDGQVAVAKVDGETVVLASGETLECLVNPEAGFEDVTVCEPGDPLSPEETEELLVQFEYHD